VYSALFFGRLGLISLAFQVLCAWPRVCMSRPFNLKFDDIVWEQNTENLQAWKDGKTGFPIVDAVSGL
jgi:deoxyribodipyrimidine photolyase